MVYEATDNAETYALYAFIARLEDLRYRLQEKKVERQELSLTDKFLSGAIEYGRRRE